MSKSLNKRVTHKAASEGSQGNLKLESQVGKGCEEGMWAVEKMGN